MIAVVGNIITMGVSRLAENMMGKWKTGIMMGEAGSIMTTDAFLQCEMKVDIVTPERRNGLGMEDMLPCTMHTEMRQICSIMIIHISRLSIVAKIHGMIDERRRQCVQ